jgi:uncharacterized membrane protein YqjE
MKPKSSKENSSGLISELLSIAKNILLTTINRVELAILEFSELNSNLFKLLLVCIVATVAFWFALGFWTIMLLILGWKILGWKMLLILALFFTTVAIGSSFYIRSILRQGWLSLPITMAELRKDRDSLL